MWFSCQRCHEFSTLSVYAAQRNTSRSLDLSDTKLPRLTVSSSSTVYILWYLVSTEMIILVLVIVVLVHPQGIHVKIELKYLQIGLKSRDGHYHWFHGHSYQGMATHWFHGHDSVTEWDRRMFCFVHFNKDWSLVSEQAKHSNHKLYEGAFPTYASGLH